jgi:hypothetical protein
MESSAGMNRAPGSSPSPSSPSPSPTRPNKKVKKGYEMASFEKVLDFKDSQSYRHKRGDGGYEPLGVWSNNEELK